MRNSGWKSYCVITIFSVYLSLIFLRQLLETTSKLKYLGNFYNCLYMEFCQITELCFFTTIHYWFTHFSYKIKHFPCILLNSIFVSIYGHIAFLGVCDFNAGINGSQFITPSAFNIWVNQLSGYIDHFSMPLYSIIASDSKKDMSFHFLYKLKSIYSELLSFHAFYTNNHFD